MKAGVVGAGILGRLLSIALHRAGWDVTLFDKTENGHSSCSMTAAGLLAPVSELNKTEYFIYQLGHSAIHLLWSDILSYLPETIYFQKRGTLTLTHPQDHAELKQFGEKIFYALAQVPANLQILTHLSNKNSHSLSSPFLRDNPIQKVIQHQIQALEPELNKFHEGYYFSEEAHIDSQAVFNALGNKINQTISWHKNTIVASVTPHQITTSTHTFHFDYVFDCRGLGAKALFSDLRSIRGELLWLHAPEVNIQRPIRFLHPRYNIYLIPRPNHIYILGASEIESEDNSPISVKTTLELLTAAYYIHPGFAEARIIESKVNHRPTLSHHLPKIKYTDGMIAINGLYRHGYLIAPSLVNTIIDYLNTDTIPAHYSPLWESYHATEAS